MGLLTEREELELLELEAKESQQQAPSTTSVSGVGGQQSLQQGDIPWSDVATGAVKNLPGSALQLGKDVVHPFMHPVDTAESLYGLASGGVQKLIPGEQEDEAKFDAVTQFFKDRYGGMENFKRTLMNDPAGFVGDLSMIMSGGGTAAARLPGRVGNIASKVAKAGNVIDPIAGTARGVGALAKTAPGQAVIGTAKKIPGKIGDVVASGIGNLGTGTGRESIRQAYLSGREGGTKAEHFTGAMRGLEAPEVIASEARDALARMRQTRQRNYQAGSKEWKADKTEINFEPVTNKMREVMESVLEGDHWTVGVESQKKLQEIADVVNEWWADPKMHTAGGLDSLKRRIDDMMPNKLDAGQSGRLVTEMRNAVKDIIVEQVPEYANVMKEYETAIRLEDEIKKGLSLGKQASVDTAMRKLLSLTRDDVTTNFGNRVNLAKALEEQGGADIMTRAAGQQMQTIAPRGLQRLAGSANIYGAMSGNPLSIATLPMQSPRLMGEAAHAAGKVHGMGDRLAQLLAEKANMTALPYQNIGRGSFQAGRIDELLRNNRR